MNFPEKFIAAGVLALFSNTAWSQEFSLQAGGGLGSFLMQEVRNVQNSFERSVPVPMKRTDDLTPGYYFDFQFRIRPKGPSGQFFTGLIYRRMTSGIRSVYEDYSGKLELRQRVDANCFGVLIGSTKQIHERWFISSGLEVFATRETYEVYGYEGYTGSTPTVIQGEAGDNSYIANFFIEGTYQSGQWSASMKAGYTFDPVTSDLLLDWAGWRLGLYAGYTFR